MKKQFLLLSLILCSAICFSQKKQEQYKRDTSFILKGKLPEFQILYTAIKSPGDVTPNQLASISKWIEGIKPVVDSVKISK